MSTTPPSSATGPAGGQTAPSGTPAAGARGDRARRTSWGHDLAMGVRFALTGGRESWVRTLLTAVGVGLGVALLLVTTSIPHALEQRHDRQRARNYMTSSSTAPVRSDHTMLVSNGETTFRDKDIFGLYLEPEGRKAPRPSGVTVLPKPGEMVVSPALKTLLASDDGALLRERLPYRIVGGVGNQGLEGPGDLVYYSSSKDLHTYSTRFAQVLRIDSFGSRDPQQPMDPVLLLLVLMVFVVLLVPVGIFIATAVRFGGERRDRRLAALRLVGADGHMTRRIAGGEAMAGALLGLAFGAGFFTVIRQLADRVVLFDISVFSSDLTPSPALTVLVALAVPAAAVGVTLFALRNVVIEPLGVVRTARPSRRRVWWRLLLPVCGLGLLYPMIGQGNDNGNFNQWMVISGTVLLLVGVTALLPWVVETVVSRLGGGPVSWQLAVRRLQMSSGTAARMVNGIGVAVAGAIALQMLFAGVQGDYTRMTKNDVQRADMTVHLPNKVPLADADRALRKTPGVQHTIPLGDSGIGERANQPEHYVSLTAGSCTALREMARLPSCHDGDAFVITDVPYDTAAKEMAKPGRQVYVDPSYPYAKGKAVPWRLPALKKAVSRKNPMGSAMNEVLLTPSVVPANAAGTFTDTVFVKLDPSVPDARDQVRNTVARLDALGDVFVMAATQQSRKFTSIRTGLFVGAACVLMLIGASLLVSQLEQLRERRKLLSVLVAFGTRRRTLSLSVLWQTAVPIVLGLVLAGGVGLVLGAVLLKMVDATVAVDWASVAAMTGIGAAVVLGVTLLSMPPLMRMMRPDGLRTE